MNCFVFFFICFCGSLGSSFTWVAQTLLLLVSSSHTSQRCSLMGDVISPVSSVAFSINTLIVQSETAEPWIHFNWYDQIKLMLKSKTLWKRCEKVNFFVHPGESGDLDHTTHFWIVGVVCSISWKIVKKKKKKDQDQDQVIFKEDSDSVMTKRL